MGIPWGAPCGIPIPGGIPGALISRTGYTGELGYELIVPAEHAGDLDVAPRPADAVLSGEIRQREPRLDPLQLDAARVDALVRARARPFERERQPREAVERGLRLFPSPPFDEEPKPLGEAGAVAAAARSRRSAPDRWTSLGS